MDCDDASSDVYTDKHIFSWLWRQRLTRHIDIHIAVRKYIRFFINTTIMNDIEMPNLSVNHSCTVPVVVTFGT